jgi:hypothetical protein
VPSSATTSVPTSAFFASEGDGLTATHETMGLPVGSTEKTLHDVADGLLVVYTFVTLTVYSE